MLTQNHAATANEFLDASEQEFAAGDHLQASEKLWGAATHAAMAVAQRRGVAAPQSPLVEIRGGYVDRRNR